MVHSSHSWGSRWCGGKITSRAESSFVADGGSLINIRLCPECFLTLPKSHNRPYCPHCDAWLIEPEDLKDVDFDCQVCGFAVWYGATLCTECGTPITESMWHTMIEDRMKYYSSPLVDPTTLCCNLPESVCECDQSVVWADLVDVPREVDEDAYEFKSHCSECVKYYEPDCPSYRSWMRDFLVEGEKSLPIDGCSEFVSYVHVPLREDL